MYLIQLKNSVGTCTGGAGAGDGRVDDGDRQVRSEEELAGDGQANNARSDDDDVECGIIRSEYPTRPGCSDGSESIRRSYFVVG